MAFYKIGKVVLKSLFKKPATLMYPLVPREWQERTRGQISIIEEDCILCGICQKKCPPDAITVDRENATWTINKMSCVQCNHCVEVCPKKCLVMEKQYTKPDFEKLIVVANPPAPKKAGASKDTKLVCDLDACIYCGICVKQCPCDALVVDRNEKLWKVDESACTKCGACLEKCPKKCLEIK